MTFPPETHRTSGLGAGIDFRPRPDGSLLRACCPDFDVTEERHREHQLRLSQTIIENMGEGVVLCRDADGLIVYANPRYSAMLGYGTDELVGQHVSVVNSPAEADPHQTAQDILAEVRHAGVWVGVVRNRRKDGRDAWIRASVARFEHQEYGTVTVSLCADVTEVHEAQQARDRAAAELQRLAASVQETIEAERAALARDLHDHLGAALAGIRMRLETVALRLPGSATSQRAEVMAIASLAQDAAVQARDISSRLRPPALDDLGIVETCRWYVGDWARHAGLRIRRRLPRLQPEPGPGVSIDLFRVLQELLTNVVRHAGASEVSVSLKGHTRHWVLRVGDNGTGIAAGRQGHGFGLLGARERVQRHGGKLAIDSSPTGTWVTVSIPHGGVG